MHFESLRTFIARPASYTNTAGGPSSSFAKTQTRLAKHSSGTNDLEILQPEKSIMNQRWIQNAGLFVQKEVDVLLRIDVLTGLFEKVYNLFVQEANAWEVEAVLWVINNLILYARLVKRRGRGCANNRKGVELWKYYSYVKWVWARKILERQL